MKKQILLFVFSILFYQFPLNAQNWQWSISGGGTQDQSNGNNREEVTHMATDNKGNIYAVTRVANSGFLNVDGHPITLPANTDATLLFSYTCDGTFRWGKLMQLGDVCALGTDTLGGVYISGMINNNVFFMGDLTDHDADTSWNIYSYDMKFLLLAKLDTLGNKEWIRQPQPDTIYAASPQSYSVDMDVEKDGTVHWMNALTPANYAGTGLILTTNGCHVLRYDRNGNFTGSTPVGLNYAPYSYTPLGYYSDRLNYSKGNNRYIVSGGFGPGDPSLTIGGNNINQPLFLASFDATTGGFNWVHQSSGAWSGIFHKPAIDKQNNIYFVAVLGTGYSFNGYTQTNVYTSLTHQNPFIQKLDPNGNALWSHGSSALGALVPGGVVVSGPEVALTNNYRGPFTWNGSPESFHSTSGTTGVNIALTRFDNTTGNYIKTDTIGGTTTAWEYPFALVADTNRNYFVGGRFEVNLVVNGNQLNTTGGAYDFFVAKFGNPTCGPPGPVGIGTTGSDHSTIKVYPNPASEYLNIENISLHSVLTIYDVLGRKEQSVYCNTEKITIPVSSLHSGIHFVQITNGGTTITKKIRIE
ncbi:MAG: hypothetical protein K0S33_2435 [Bacteroidetes bacterium]|nr:hypothetical protein [Bacteroidota bacterium]